MSGMWGMWSQPAAGFVAAGLSFPVKEMATLPQHSSKGTSGVLVNGRVRFLFPQDVLVGSFTDGSWQELAAADVVMLQAMGVPCSRGKWKIDGDGVVTREGDVRKPASGDPPDVKVWPPFVNQEGMCFFMLTGARQS